MHTCEICGDYIRKDEDMVRIYVPYHPDDFVLEPWRYDAYEYYHLSCYLKRLEEARASDGKKGCKRVI